MPSKVFRESPPSRGGSSLEIPRRLTIVYIIQRYTAADVRELRIADCDFETLGQFIATWLRCTPARAIYLHGSRLSRVRSLGRSRSGPSSRCRCRNRRGSAQSRERMLQEEIRKCPMGEL